MLHRLAVVIYVFLHIPLAILPVSTLLNSRYWQQLDINTYQARCNNGELVVLQGTVDGSPYTFNDTHHRTNGESIDESLRFYCGHYDGARAHIVNYINSLSTGRTFEANQAFWEFRNEAPRVYAKNYELEVIEGESDYSYLWYAILDAATVFLLYYIALQVVRVIYQYVAFGVFTWHPYKLRRRKRKEEYESI